MDRKKYRILHNVQFGKLMECAFFFKSVIDRGYLSLMSFIKMTSVINLSVDKFIADNLKRFAII